MTLKSLAVSNDFVAVATGGSLSMALRADGTVVAWGTFGTEGRAYVPEGLVGVTSIAAGYFHCVAVKEDGTVLAWGVDERSLLSVPRGLTGVTAVAAGFSHSLALKGDGTVVAWGDNSGGGCSVPTGLSGVASVAVGSSPSQSIAVLRDGTVVVWGGYNKTLEGVDALTDVVSFDGLTVLKRDGFVCETNGKPVSQIRIGSDVIDIPPGVLGATAVAGGFILRSDGTVVYRGDYHFHDELAVPRDLDGVSAIAASDAHVLALKNDGSIVAWGGNSRGEIDVPAAGELVAQDVPAPRTYPTATTSEGPRHFVAVAAGWEHSLALRNDGTVVAWGSNSRGQLDVPRQLTGAVQIAAGAKHSIALLSDGTVVTWGRTVGGPVYQPDELSDVVAVAAGGDTNLALKNNGTLIMWTQSFTETEDLPVDWVDIAASALGGDTPIALRHDGRMLVKERRTGIKVAPTGLTGVASVVASYSTAYALRRDGTVVSWGDVNPLEQPFMEGRYATGQEVRFPNPSDVTAISAGWRHAVALKRDGSVVAWGDNADGQAAVPMGLNNVVAVAAGEAHSLALIGDGRIVSWGLNRDGQLNAPGPESDSVDSNSSRVVLNLVFCATKNVTGTRSWKFSFGETTAAGTWITGYRNGDLVFEDSPLAAELSGSYYSAMIFRVMEQYFPSFKWEGDVSQTTTDSEDWKFPIVLRGKISVRQQDLAGFLAEQTN